MIIRQQAYGNDGCLNPFVRRSLYPLSFMVLLHEAH